MLEVGTTSGGGNLVCALLRYLRSCHCHRTQGGRRRRIRPQEYSLTPFKLLYGNCSHLWMPSRAARCPGGLRPTPSSLLYLVPLLLLYSSSLTSWMTTTCPFQCPNGENRWFGPISTFSSFCHSVVNSTSVCEKRRPATD